MARAHNNDFVMKFLKYIAEATTKGIVDARVLASELGSPPADVEPDEHALKRFLAE